MKKTPAQEPLRLDRTTIARLDDASLPLIVGGIRNKSVTCTDCSTWGRCV